MKRLIFFVLGVMLAAACTDDYDDSALKDRIDGLEDRVDAHDALLKELRAAVDNFNATNAAFTKLLNNGVITEVTPFEDNGRSGLQFTVRTPEGDTTYKVYDGKDGQNGQNGQNGQSGHSPQLGLASEDDGRKYWTLDGEPLLYEGQKVYATGERGEKGENGVTPEFKVEKDAATPEDQQTYWWVSTDGKETEDPGKTWQKLTPITGEVTTVEGVNLSYDKAAQTVTFTLQEQSYTFDVMPSSFTVSNTDKNHFHNGQTRTYDYEIGDAGSSEYLVKASLQNANDDFSVRVDPLQKRISVTANKPGATNTVDVELVKQNGTCKHCYFEVFSDVSRAGFENNDEAVLTGSEAGYDDSPIRIGFDQSVRETLTFNVAVETTLPEGSYDIPKTLEVTSGRSSAQLEYTVDGSKLTAGMGYTLSVTLSSESEFLEFESPVYKAVVGTEMVKMQLSADNYSSPFDGASEVNDPSSAYAEGGGIAALCDGLSTPHFGSAYWSIDAFTTYSQEIKEYGVWVDVSLTETMKALKFRFQQRNGNGKVIEYKVGAGVEANLQVVGTGTAQNQQGEGWNETAGYICPQGSNKARFGVTKSSQGVLTESPKESMALLELEVYVLK